MSFLKGLLAGRSHVAFLAGLALAVVVVYTVGSPAQEERGKQGDLDFAQRLEVGDQPPLRETGQPLDETEQRQARIAWRYFENNVHAETGLADSVAGYGRSTLWDQGSYLLALLAAEQLGLVDPSTFDRRCRTFLRSLARLPLVAPGIPGRGYDVRTLALDPEALEGWSMLDIARLLVPLDVLVWTHPELTGLVREVFAGWKLETGVDQGQLYAGVPVPGGLNRAQEGRFGYEQYAARAVGLLHLDVSHALGYAHVAFTKVSGQLVPYDARLPRDSGGVHNALVSDPFIMAGLEFGLDRQLLPISRAVLIAQMNRARETGEVVAVGEDNLDRAPYFAFDSLLNDMKPWAVFTATGVDASAYRTLSTKAAFGWAYLFGGAYSTRLLAAVADANDPERGWYAGRYASDGSWNRALTANTNGLILEAFAYKTHGPWLRASRER